MTMKPLNDERVEGLIANLLRTGVVIAALVVIGGAVPYLAEHPWAHVSYRAFHGEPDELKAVHEIIPNAFSGDPRGCSQRAESLLPSVISISAVACTPVSAGSAAISTCSAAARLSTGSS